MLAKEPNRCLMVSQRTSASPMEAGGHGERLSPAHRGLHSSTFRLNVSTFCGYVGCMISPQSIRQGDTGRCDSNGLG
jgi:hypothetical protein